MSIILNSVKSFTGLNKIKSKASIFDLFHLKYNPNEVNRLKKLRQYITVSNRPFGLIEEIILYKLFQENELDTSFLNNSWLEELDLQRLKTIDEKDFTKNELELTSDQIYSLFPVGPISAFQTPTQSFTDSEWDKEVLHSIYHNQLPVIPIYLKGHQEAWTSALGMIHPLLKTRSFINLLLEGESFTVEIRIGKPIKINEFENYYDSNHFGRFLRAKLYTLDSGIRVENFYLNQNKEEITDELPSEVLSEEIATIRDANCIGVQGNFEVYLSKAKKIPLLIQEIGRQRELTFRAVGEGTNQATDLDEYDLHYLHLFVWDKEANRLVGAYRIGDGSYIMKTYGKKGFYLKSLFKMNDEMDGILARSFELGRSFVVPDYQRQRLPLFLLWRGIAYFIKQHPQLKYIIGPVSISNTYSELSKKLMIEYIKTNHWNKVLAKMVRPKKQFQSVIAEEYTEVLVDSTSHQIKKLDELIEDIEPLGLKTPVLLRKYFSQNAQIIAFNVDPKFNHALDGFMFLKIKDLPADSLETF